MEAGARSEPFGSDLRIAAWGPDLAACVDVALRAFADHVAEVPDEASRVRRVVELVADDARDLFVEVVDEAIARIDVDGELACGFGGRVEDEPDGSVRLVGELQVVGLQVLALVGAPPKATTWHAATVERRDDGWHASVVLDL